MEQGNSTKTRHATNMRSSKHTRMDQPKASIPKWAAARALQLKMQIYYLRWLHRSWVVRQETEGRVGYLLAMQRQNRKSPPPTKTSISTVINSMWDEHNRGYTNRGDGSEMVRRPCKGGGGYWNPTVAVEENTI